MPYPYMIIHNCRIEVVWVDEYTLSFPAAFGQYFYGRTPSIIATTESTHTDGSTDASEMGNVNVHVDSCFMCYGMLVYFILTRANG